MKISSKCFLSQIGVGIGIGIGFIDSGILTCTQNSDSDANKDI